MTTVEEKRRADAAHWVGILTLTWFLTVPLLVLFGFFDVLSFGVEPNPHEARGEALLVIAAVLTGALPLVATVVAARGRRPLLSTVYAIITLVMLVPAVAVAGGVLSDDRPVVPGSTPEPPGRCVEHSGGDTRCPGG